MVVMVSIIFWGDFRWEIRSVRGGGVRCHGECDGLRVMWKNVWFCFAVGNKNSLYFVGSFLYMIYNVLFHATSYMSWTTSPTSSTNPNLPTHTTTTQT